MTNLEKYLNAIRMIKAMRDSGALTDEEYNKSEGFFADKYCIKTNSLFRPIDLINTPFRAMYIPEEKEATTNGKRSNED